MCKIHKTTKFLTFLTRSFGLFGPVSWPCSKPQTPVCFHEHKKNTNSNTKHKIFSLQLPHEKLKIWETQLKKNNKGHGFPPTQPFSLSCSPSQSQIKRKKLHSPITLPPPTKTQFSLSLSLSSLPHQPPNPSSTPGCVSG